VGKVQAVFGNGSPGAITRSVDDIVISVKNAYGGEIIRKMEERIKEET
jgi:hypothetical protein